MSTPSSPPPLDTKAFARAVGVEPETVRRWCRPTKRKDGTEEPPLLVPAFRTPTGFMRFTEAQVEEVKHQGAGHGRGRDIEAHVAAAMTRARQRRRMRQKGLTG